MEDFITKNFNRHMEKIENIFEKEIFTQIYDNIYFLNKKILQRDFSYFNIHVRYLSDLFENILRWKLQKINIRPKFRRLGKSKKIDIGHLLKHQSGSNFSDNALKSIKWLKDSGNKYAHSDFKHSHKVYDEIKLNLISFEDAIKTMEIINIFLNWSLNLNVFFDKSIYFTIDKVLERDYYKYIFDYVGSYCTICKSGKIIVPEREEGKPGMVYGPYLKCDNCSSVISSSLKVKIKNTEYKCPDCNSEVKTVHDLKLDEWYYQCINFEKCQWLGTKKDIEDSLNKFSDDILNSSASFFKDITKTKEQEIEWDDDLDPNDILNDYN